MFHEPHRVPAAWADRALISRDSYAERWRRSVSDPDGFWREEAQRIDWLRPFDTVKDTSFAAEDFRIRWFEGGQLNIAANCLDRHLAERGDQPAILWEADDPAAPGRTLTYRQLHTEVCRLGNALKRLGWRAATG